MNFYLFCPLLRVCSEIPKYIDEKEDDSHDACEKSNINEAYYINQYREGEHGACHCEDP